MGEQAPRHEHRDPRPSTSGGRRRRGSADEAVTALLAGDRRIHRASELSEAEPSSPSPWRLPHLQGRLIECTGHGDTAVLTVTANLVRAAQHLAEPVAWISRRTSHAHPSDLAATGIDLDALPVVRVPDGHSAGRAADKLLRSGAFGLLVLDLGDGAHLPDPLLGRLVQLAGQHHTAVLCLTESAPAAPSLSSLISLRLDSHRHPDDGEPTDARRFRVGWRADKDKRCGPGWQRTEVVHGPAGLH